MAIEKMELVTIVGLMSELDTVLLKCCESGCFHMEPAFLRLRLKAADSSFLAIKIRTMCLLRDWRLLRRRWG